MDIEGKVVIVTGSSRGIGKAIALLLAENGANVAVNCNKNTDDGQMVVDEIKKKGGSAIMVKADVTKENEVERLLKETVKEFGGIDVLINNAGIDSPKGITEYTLDEWNRILNTNLTSVFLTTKHAIPYLKDSDEPVIINMSSRLGLPDVCAPQSIPYSVSKAAVSKFTINLSRELEGEGIRVNGIIPVMTRTDLIEGIIPKEELDEIEMEGNLGKPEEVADMVLSVILNTDLNGEIVMDERLEQTKYLRMK